MKLKLKLERRYCQCGCGSWWRCLPQSTSRYASVWHDPTVFQDAFIVKSRSGRAPREQKTNRSGNLRNLRSDFLDEDDDY